MADPLPPPSVETMSEMPIGGFGEILGLEMRAVGPEEVVIGLPIGAHLHQPYGVVHGGVWCALVETAASVGAAAWLGRDGQVVGVANHTDFLRAVRQGTVVARATPIHRGRTQQLWLVEIRDEDDRLVARGEVRLQNLTSADGLGRS